MNLMNNNTVFLIMIINLKMYAMFSYELLNS